LRPSLLVGAVYAEHASISTSHSPRSARAAPEQFDEIESVLRQVFTTAWDAMRR